MSYRTFDHLLGETALERKCRFLLGSLMFALVVPNYYLAGRLAETSRIAQFDQAWGHQISPLPPGYAVAKADLAQSLAHTRAILICSAMATAMVGMFASYAIVRYFIGRPVAHLRRAAAAIAAGDLDIRSGLKTGDEFEELACALERVRHNLAAMRQGLRDAGR